LMFGYASSFLQCTEFLCYHLPLIAVWTVFGTSTLYLFFKQTQSFRALVLRAGVSYTAVLLIFFFVYNSLHYEEYNAMQWFYDCTLPGFLLSSASVIACLIPNKKKQ